MSRFLLPLLQSIHYQGEELDLSFFQSVTFIETTSLDSPKLMIEYNDSERYLRDDLRLIEKEELTIVLADPVSADELNWRTEWIIMTMPSDDKGMVTFNLMPKLLYQLKLPCDAAKFFTKEAISSVLRNLAPNLSIDVGTFPIRTDFHLLPGQRPSRLIRQMAKELGALAFVRRGTLVFKSLKELQARSANYKYHYNDTREQYQIAKYTAPQDVSIIDDLTQRNFIGWDDKKGLIKSRKHTSAPVEHTGITNQAILDNLSKIPTPVIDFYTQGNGGLNCGDVIEAVWNRSDLERPLDESLPNKFVIGLVAHSATNKTYHCRVKGVIERG